MAVKKTGRRGRPRKATASTTKKTGAKRGRPRKATASTTKKTGAKRGRPRKATSSVSAPAKRRGRPAKAKSTATAKKKTARKLTVGDCGGKLTRSRLVGGYGLKKRVRKPKMARRGRPRK
jgi:colicin import membrane protein